MATPFARFASLRMLWQRPTADVTSLREGIRPNTEMIAIEAYVDDMLGSSGEQSSGGRNIASTKITGFITRWAIVPSGDNWLGGGVGWQWNNSGLRPSNLPRGEKLEAFIGNLSILPDLSNGERGWLTIDSLSSVGGIDALVRVKAGDEFSGVFAAGR
jgi:hypothetical protein